MSARVKGHYRIDSTGRIEPLADVNASAKPYAGAVYRSPGLGLGERSLIKKMISFGTGLCVIGAMLLATLPQIERAVLSAEAAHAASMRASYIQSHPGLGLLLARRR